MPLWLKLGLLYLKYIFSPPLDSFGCYCCNLKLVSSVKRCRLLCNWSCAGYWRLVSGRWQPIKTIDWGSSRVQPMGINKSITNNDFPNQVICHQSPGGFTPCRQHGARQHQAGTLCNSCPQPGHIHILYKVYKALSSIIYIVRSPKILDAESSICILPNTRQNIFDLTKRSRKRAMCACALCSIGMQPPSLGGYLAQVGITRGQH